MRSANRSIVAILLVAALAVGFWMLLLGPKREKAHELSSQVDALEVSLAEAQSRVNEATAAKRAFPSDYRQLVVLGQAVPANDETSSLLVELNGVAASSQVSFDAFTLSAGQGGTEAPPPEAPPVPTAPAGDPSGAVQAAATVPPTEAAASLLPLGATIGPAGLGVMPYRLTFSGDFFQVADFIDGIDSLVDTGSSALSVRGRLVTLDGFALNADPELKFPHLDANFSVTTYVTPPSQGLTAGASPTEPAPAASEEPGAEEPAEETQTAAAQ
jgi:Tfp pilus assembly protein PilO